MVSPELGVGSLERGVSHGLRLLDTVVRGIASIIRSPIRLFVPIEGRFRHTHCGEPS